MTRNAIPILVDEGVQAITIGVNGGSAPPGVPKNIPFIWRDNPSGKEIVTVVHPGMPSCCCYPSYVPLGQEGKVFDCTMSKQEVASQCQDKAPNMWQLQDGRDGVLMVTGVKSCLVSA